MLLVVFLNVFVGSIIVAWIAGVLNQALQKYSQPTELFNDVFSVMRPLIPVAFVMNHVVNWMFDIKLVVSLRFTS